jgi:hypothetical protein
MPRVHIPNMKELLERRADLSRRGVNQQAHERLHGPATIVYNTSSTLDTTAGPGLRMPRGGQITRISGRVSGAPTSKMEIGIYIDGVNVLGTAEYLTIQTSEKVAKYKIVRRPYFNEDSVFTVQIQTVAAATGPLVLTIEYLPEY